MSFVAPPLPPVNLSGRAKFWLSGPDATRYLNGQITNDVRKLGLDVSLPACVLDAKGRMQALVYIRNHDRGGFLLDAPGVLRDTLASRLERYIIADDVQLEDVTEHYALFYVKNADLLDQLPFTSVLFSKRFGEDGHDIWIPTSEAETLSWLRATAIDESNPLLQALRIARGFPAWGAELSPDSLPGEAGLDRWAVDFAKGCYIGQEVVSRMRSVGHPAKVLRRFRVTSGPAPEPGWMLLDQHGKNAGVITSVTDGAFAGLRAALGYVKWAFSTYEFFAKPPGNSSSETQLAVWE